MTLPTIGSLDVGGVPLVDGAGATAAATATADLLAEPVGVGDALPHNGIVGRGGRTVGGRRGRDRRCDGDRRRPALGAEPRVVLQPLAALGAVLRHHVKYLAQPRTSCP